MLSRKRHFISSYSILNLLCFVLFLLGVHACTFEKKDELVDCSLIEDLSIVAVQNTQCGEAVGSIEVMVESSDLLNQSITFQLNGANSTNDPIFENLSAGTYEITATIDGDCAKSIVATIENEDGLSISLNTSNADCGTANGQIEILAENANGTVQYKIDGADFQSNATFSALTPGSYIVTARDEIGCEVIQEVKLLSKVTFAEIENIVNTNCALSGCHGGGVSPNLSTPESIEQFADRIQQRTGNQSMPPASSGISLQPSEIEAIACWVFDKN